MMMLLQQQQRIRHNLIVNGYIVISYLLLYLYAYVYENQQHQQLIEKKRRETVENE